MLVLMLPVRGVMAAAMPCPPSASTTGTSGLAGEAGAAPVHHHADADADAAADHPAAHADPAGAAAHHDGATGAERCNLCSACCSVPPLASAAPAVALPHGPAGGGFPHAAAPAPSFIADGQDRPPPKHLTPCGLLQRPDRARACRAGIGRPPRRVGSSDDFHHASP
ncbi:MAG: hypothetical protein LCI02_10660 [Proteobacteria bacterium]|nr:hypothetical protein [Pseudomonadota bacterium]